MDTSFAVPTASIPASQTTILGCPLVSLLPLFLQALADYPFRHPFWISTLPAPQPISLPALLQHQKQIGVLTVAVAYTLLAPASPAATRRTRRAALTPLVSNRLINGLTSTCDTNRYNS